MERQERRQDREETGERRNSKEIGERRISKENLRTRR
jgi:hypothetical protein